MVREQKGSIMRAEAFDSTVIQNNIFYPNPMVLDNLRNQIRQIERSGKLLELPPVQNEPTISLGDTKINGALPWGGLPTTGLHEIFGDPAAVGFTAVLINKLVKNSDTPILWCQRGHDLYGHGLAEFGIDPDRLILVKGKNDNEILWAMEEGLRSAGIAGVIGRPYKIPPIAGRRLQLAAEENGVPGLLLRPQDYYKKPQGVVPTNAALTRWHVTTAPSITPASGLGLSPPKWNLELQRYRYSALNLQKQKNKQRIARRVTAWQVEWCHETGDLSVVADLCNGSAQPQQRKQKIG
jgi:protein ImuA